MKHHTEINNIHISPQNLKQEMDDCVLCSFIVERIITTLTVASLGRLILFALSGPAQPDPAQPGLHSWFAWECALWLQRETLTARVTKPGSVLGQRWPDAGAICETFLSLTDIYRKKLSHHRFNYGPASRRWPIVGEVMGSNLSFFLSYWVIFHWRQSNSCQSGPLSLFLLKTEKTLLALHFGLVFWSAWDSTVREVSDPELDVWTSNLLHFVNRIYEYQFNNIWECLSKEVVYRHV